MGKRATDEQGPTPGERAEKWLTNAKMAITLYITLTGAALYGNSETVRTFIHGPGDVVSTAVTREENFARINDEFEDVRAEIQSLRAESRKKDSVNEAELKAMIEKNAATIRKWHGVDDG